jgi:hypothetical protein
MSNLSPKPKENPETGFGTHKKNPNSKNLLSSVQVSVKTESSVCVAAHIGVVEFGNGSSNLNLQKIEALLANFEKSRRLIIDSVANCKFLAKTLEPQEISLKKAFCTYRENQFSFQQ